MDNNTVNTIKEYVSPTVEELNLNNKSIICATTEGTGEEEW